MNSGDKKRISWRQKIFYEMFEYWVNFIYLAIFFAMFTWYRRLILAEYQIIYLDWGVGLIEAAVLGKIIMLRGVLCFGCGGLEEKPLIIPTLYKTVLFSVWAGIFTVLEHTIRGLRHGKGLMGGLDELVSKDWHELLAGCMVIFFAFIPFFAFKEMGRVLGEGKIRGLFFRRRTIVESDLDRCKID